jgi:two-component system, sensor histidine kinase and response regulator
LIGRRTTGGFLVRRLLPDVVVVPIVLGLLRLEGERAGLYGMTVWVALMTRWFDRLEEKNRQAEEALEQTEEKYRGIFDNAAEGIYQTNLKGNVITANPALARMFGYDSPEDMTSSVTAIARQHFEVVGRRLAVHERTSAEARKQ